MRVLPEEPPEDLDRRWERLCKRLAARFGKSPSLEGVLFLIGLRELGLGYEPGLEKEAKQDLIQEGANYALAALGYLEPMGREPHTGFTQWRSLRPLDKPLDPDKQERLLRWAAWRYFLACWPDLEEEAG
ncbi:MAG: hypothetical protein N2561_06030 [Bacteroidetes bacterium]|nr:hypothetical protein [Bacteroidota bacterium]